jgi:hypothetical protein
VAVDERLQIRFAKHGCVGKSANGRIEWRDKAGRTLRDIQDSTVAKVKAAAAE